VNRVRARLAGVAVALAVGVGGAFGAGFDHGYAGWDALLRAHVAWNDRGVASGVDYAGIARDRAQLRAVLEGFSALGHDEYAGFSREQKLAFLLNAYNAFTIELVLTRYPDLRSIKELGFLFRSPWQKRFFALLGEERSLDDVEHGMIRAPGVFDEPRIHFVAVCASVGCPALRPEAFTAMRLEAQLEDSTRRFLRDRTRNRFRAATLEVSRIFDWYEEDFEKSSAGSRRAFLARYAEALAAAAGDAGAIQQGRYTLRFLEYDWKLNDRPRSAGTAW